MSLAKHLYEARQPFTSQVPFTIINAYSPKSNMSYGYDDKPSDIFYSNNTPLVLTFALTRDKKASTTEANVVRKPYKNMFLWGDSVFNRSKYLTVKITPEQFSEFKLDQMLISNMRYLYFIVGAFTKNLVRHDNWFGSKPTFIDEGHTGIEAIVHAISIPDLFKNYDFPHWAYNEYVWQKAQNLIVEDHINDNLLLYYSAYLHKQKPEHGTVGKIFEDKLQKFLTKGLFQIVGGINGGNTYVDKPGIAALIYLSRELTGESPSYVNEKQWAFDILSELRDHVNSDDDLKKQIIKAFNNKRDIVTKLINDKNGDRFIHENFKGVRHVFG